MDNTKVDDLSYDLFNLSASDVHPIDIDKYKQSGSEYLQELSTQNMQMLMGKLFDLPTSSEDDGLFISLPTQSVLIPREKPVPKEKKPTAWEEFAKAKNIRDIKKDKLVYDKEHDEFRPRFGWGRANNAIQDDWVIEAKHNGKDLESGFSSSDPFLERQQEKKKKVKQQLVNQVRNMRKSGQESSSIPSSLNIANIPNLNPKRARLDLKNDLKEAYSTVSVSTASMGKFDKKLAKEPKQSKVKSKNKLSERANMGNGSAPEKAASLSLLDRVLKTQATKKRQVRDNSANTFQRVMEAQSRSKKREHLVGKNKARFGGGKNDKKKGGKITGKKRSRAEVEF